MSYYSSKDIKGVLKFIYRRKVEGAFVQGLGLYTLEQQYYTPEGIPLMTGPENYKIPTASDIPREFRIALLRNSENNKAVLSSKVKL